VILYCKHQGQLSYNIAAQEKSNDAFGENTFALRDFKKGRLQVIFRLTIWLIISQTFLIEKFHPKLSGDDFNAEFKCKNFLNHLVEKEDALLFPETSREVCDFVARHTTQVYKWRHSADLIYWQAHSCRWPSTLTQHLGHGSSSLWRFPYSWCTARLRSFKFWGVSSFDCQVPEAPPDLSDKPFDDLSYDCVSEKHQYIHLTIGGNETFQKKQVL